MIDEVPESVASEIEKLVAGEGPFVDLRESELLRTEDITLPSMDDPQVQDDADAVQAATLGRLEAMEQTVPVSPVDRIPKMLPDQNVEFGLATGSFTSGTTITITPCDVEGAVTGESNVVVFVRADRSSATVTIADSDVLSWERFDTIEDSDSAAGVLVGAVAAELSDQITGDTCTIGTKGTGTSEWIAVATDGALQRVRHNAPGPSCFSLGEDADATGPICGRVMWINLDELGHVKIVRGKHWNGSAYVDLRTGPDA